jgi:aspergillopepsin I
LTPANETGTRPLYNPSNSTTWKQLDGYTWAIGYADLSGAKGIVGTDTVNIGGMTVTSATVEAATSVSAEFTSNSEIDGLLGLAFPKINTVKPVKAVPPFFQAMDSLPEPLFTATLKHEQPGTYDFGYIDSSKYTGAISYVPVNQTLGYWTFQSAGYQLAGKNYNASYPSIADTGTSLLLMNPDVVKAYYATVKGSYFSNENGGYMYPCLSKAPDFGVELGNGYYGIIPSALMTYTKIDLDLNCYGSLQANTGMPYSLQIFGDIVFKTQFVVFNGGTAQLGFAKQA